MAGILRPPKEQPLQLGMRVVSWSLLILWAIWWVASFSELRLIDGYRTWIPPWNFLGLDYIHNYYAVHYWLGTGGNPYVELFGDPRNIPYNYAPIVLILFAWSYLLDVVAAIIVWSVVIALIAAAAAWMSHRVRKNLQLWDLPFVAVLTATLCSSSIVFAMERGNCDILVLSMILIATWQLRREGLLVDVIAGGALAVATWVKIYPGALFVGLLFLRRRRAAVAMVVIGIIIGVVPLPATLQWMHNIRTDVDRSAISPIWISHSLSSFWPYIWENSPFESLARIPGLIAAAIALAPGVLWVGVRVFKNPNRRRLIYPYLLWMTAVSTVWAPISYDYKLFFLILAALAVWDARDRVYVHLMMAPFLLYWQPMRLTIGLWPLFCFKLLALVSVGASLLRRCDELLADETVSPVKEPPQDAIPIQRDGLADHVMHGTP